MAGGQHTARGMRAAWLQAARSEGPLALYRGLGVALASTAAYKALYFGLYDTVKEMSTSKGSQAAQLDPTSPAVVLQRFALAASTTFAAATLTYPLDTIRKRMIVAVGVQGPDGRPQPLQHHSFRTCVQGILQREGVAGFYRFWAYDATFRLGGGVLLVLYDLLQEGRQARWSRSGQPLAEGIG